MMPRRGTELRDDARSNLSAATTAIWPRLLGLTFETLEDLISGHPTFVPKLTRFNTRRGTYCDIGIARFSSLYLHRSRGTACLLRSL